MYLGHAGFGIFLMVFHLTVAGAFLFFMVNISKSLKKIVDNPDTQSVPAIETNQKQQLFE